MSDTISTVLALAYSTLSGDATFMGLVTGVYQDIAPTGSAPDYAILSIQSPGADTLTATGVRILSNPLLLLKVVGPASDMANIGAAYARADALLQPSGRPLRNTGGTLALYRESPFYLPDPSIIAGAVWVQLGGLYRVVL